ncbi:hypothetical protein BJ973_003190 [Actinoplanes tereljensis]|uniref:LPXTG-motif cell wall-anchored protein n=1 Tax=Paractinoplanes tereljensis TaxID=571912 RepID=A0A919NX27_9ACTN|nr:hypothetical protein [Actinoplanes tereljensis]GIF25918.1 hypothetical protein Ate02nite_86480 [Actinoplanes tereljensis]
MNRVLVRRLLAAGAAAFVAAAVAAPAQAASPAVNVLLPDVTVAAGGSTYAAPLLFAEESDALTGGKIVYELSGDLTGVALATVDGDPGCVNEGPAKLVCTDDFYTFVGPDGGLADFAAVTATKAALGEKGKLTVTFSADGIATSTRTVDVNVAEGVDLVAGKTQSVSAKPGSSFTASLQVTNSTDTVVHGTALLAGTDYAIAGVKQFSNCFYADGVLNACTFDEELQPGATYQVELPYQLRKDTLAPGKATGDYEWLTAGDYDDLIKFVGDNGFDGPGNPGTDGKLTLKQISTPKSAAKQTDPNPDNNWQALDVTVTGQQGADLAAVGATASGAAGTTVSIPVGVKNLGPATLASQFGLPAAAALVTIPTGATVTGVPDACFRNTTDSILKGDANAVQYACFTDEVLPAGTTVTWKFALKITKVVPGARGSVQLNPKCECDAFKPDANKANDTAQIVLNGTSTGGTTGGDENTGGEGGGLPITGPQTAFIGIAGAALIAAGIAGFMVTRRRRTRFEA